MTLARAVACLCLIAAFLALLIDARTPSRREAKTLHVNFREDILKGA